MKCDKCGFVSFEHNQSCPSCGKDLTVARQRLGIFLQPPRVTLDVFFSQDSGAFRSAAFPVNEAPKDEANLDMDTDKDDLEFTLD